MIGYSLIPMNYMKVHSSSVLLKKQREYYTPLMDTNYFFKLLPKCRAAFGKLAPSILYYERLFQYTNTLFL